MMMRKKREEEEREGSEERTDILMGEEVVEEPMVEREEVVEEPTVVREEEKIVEESTVVREEEKIAEESTVVTEEKIEEGEELSVVEGSVEESTVVPEKMVDNSTVVMDELPFVESGIEESPVVTEEMAEERGEKVGKRKGRPRKEKVEEPVVKEEVEEPVVKKKGRPRKKEIEEPPATEEVEEPVVTEEIEEPVVKKKGRPRKEKGNDLITDEEVNVTTPPSKRGRRSGDKSEVMESLEEGGRENVIKKEGGQEEEEERPRKRKMGRPKKVGVNIKGELEKGTEQGNSEDQVEEAIYEVEMLLAKRGKGNKKQYLVRWRGYDDFECSWEPTDNLDCKETIRAFEDSVRELRYRPRKPEDITLLEILGKKVSGLPFCTFLTKNIYDFFKLLVNERGPTISVINTIDDEGPPTPFSIITEDIRGPEVPAIDRDKLVGCNCKEGCSALTRRTCSCHNIAHKPNTYDKSRSLILPPHHAIFECNMNCQCSPDCLNRTIQRGRKFKLQIFRTPHKGWGIRALERIPSGKFVVELLGEIVTRTEADRRSSTYDVIGQSCLIDLDFLYNSTQPCLYTLDFYHQSSIARFINHSCQPNLALYPTFYDSTDLSLYHLSLFSLRDIEIHEELHYDYFALSPNLTPDLATTPVISNGFDTIPSRPHNPTSPNPHDPTSTSPPPLNPAPLDRGTLARHRCYCESPNCRQFLPVLP